MKKNFLAIIAFCFLAFLTMPDAISATFEDDVGYSISLDDMDYEVANFDIQTADFDNIVAVAEMEVPVLKYPINSYNMIILEGKILSQDLYINSKLIDKLLANIYIPTNGNIPIELNNRGMDNILKSKHPINNFHYI